MDWLILILGVPAILIPLVLLFGFAGCGSPASYCTGDEDCPVGTHCSDGACFANAEPDPAPPAPSAPVDLHATARDDHSVSLRWTNTEPAPAEFQIERAAEDGGFEPVIPAPTDLSDNGGTDTDASGLQEGLSYIYRVRALLGPRASDPSDTSSATVLPKAPVNLVATPAGINQIVVSWDNASAVATLFSLEHRLQGGTFQEIYRDTAPTFTDTRPVEGTHEYQVFAIVDGVEDDVPQDGGVKSAATAIAATFAFTAAFTAPPGTLTTDDTGAEGICAVQRLSRTLLTASGTQVRIFLRGSTVGSLTLDRITISQPAATGDPYDSAPDLTDVASGVTIPPNTPVTVGPVNYTLDRTKDLLVAFDISNTPGEGNTRFGALTGGDTFVRAATAEAGVQDRTTGYPAVTANNVALIEKIEVL